jgi:hypothetical protein
MDGMVLPTPEAGASYERPVPLFQILKQRTCAARSAEVLERSSVLSALLLAIEPERLRGIAEILPEERRLTGNE